MNHQFSFPFLVHGVMSHDQRAEVHDIIDLLNTTTEQRKCIELYQKQQSISRSERQLYIACLLYYQVILYIAVC